MSKRFEIVLYHLDKIISEWGECEGLSARDTWELSSMHRKLEELYKKGEPFRAYAGEIDECEFN